MIASWMRRRDKTVRTERRQIDIAMPAGAARQEEAQPSRRVARVTVSEPVERSAFVIVPPAPHVVLPLGQDLISTQRIVIACAVIVDAISGLRALELRML